MFNCFFLLLLFFFRIVWWIPFVDENLSYFLVELNIDHNVGDHFSRTLFHVNVSNLSNVDSYKSRNEVLDHIAFETALNGGTIKLHAIIFGKENSIEKSSELCNILIKMLYFLIYDILFNSEKTQILNITFEVKIYIISILEYSFEISLKLNFDSSIFIIKIRVIVAKQYSFCDVVDRFFFTFNFNQIEWFKISSHFEDRHRSIRKSFVYLLIISVELGMSS